ncbi:hypothetical protein [Bradyrhizobium sp. USDA 3315]
MISVRSLGGIVLHLLLDMQVVIGWAFDAAPSEARLLPWRFAQ